MKKKRTEQTWYERLSTKTPVDNKACDVRLQVWTVATGLVVARALTGAGAGQHQPRTNPVWSQLPALGDSAP